MIPPCVCRNGRPMDFLILVATGSIGAGCFGALLLIPTHTDNPTQSEGNAASDQDTFIGRDNHCETGR